MRNNTYMYVKGIGEIFVRDEIIYFDKLLTFSCYNSVGNFYIANCIEITEEMDEEWIFLPISSHKMTRLFHGGITAYQSFTEPETGFLHFVKFENGDYENGSSSLIEPISINDDDLPDSDIVYDIYADELFNISEQELKDLDKIAVDENRNILDISLEMNETHSHEIPAKFLGNVLNQTQRIIDLISYKNSESYKIPNNIKEENTLIYTGQYASSFGFRLKSDKFADLLGESTLHESIVTLMDLLNSEVELEGFKELFTKLNPNVLKAYREYLELLSKENASIITKSSSPNRTYKQSILSVQDIESKLEMLRKNLETEEKTISLKGILVATDLTNSRFKFETFDSEVLKGKISNEINLDVFELPRQAKIKLIKRKEKDFILNKEKYEYILTDIDYIP